MDINNSFSVMKISDEKAETSIEPNQLTESGSNSKKRHDGAERQKLLNEIEKFDKSSLVMAPEEEPYLFSPFDDVSMFVDDAIGLGREAMFHDEVIVKPVFKDKGQAFAFYMAIREILNDFDRNHDGVELNKQEDDEYYMLCKLEQWSHPKKAVIGFKDVHIDDSHPIVFLGGGHGAAGSGDVNIGREVKTAAKIAKILNEAGLPTLSPLNALACYSGTENNLEKMRDIEKSASGQERGNLYESDQLKLKSQKLEFSAGNWNKTFSGQLEAALNDVDKSNNRRQNRVAGYMGTTGILPSGKVNTLSDIGKPGIESERLSTKIYDESGKKIRVKRDVLARKGPEF